MTSQVPLVRGPDGTVLGIDHRQTELVRPEYRVPGWIPIAGVMPGDSVVVPGDSVVVHQVLNGGGVTAIYCLSAGGAPIVIARSADELVHVIAVGAFEPAEATS